jgi:hypothetical protein
LLTAPVAAFLRARYRRAVIGSMAGNAGAAAGAPRSAPAALARAHVPLALREPDADETTDQAFPRRALQSAWSRAAAWAPSVRHESPLRLLRLSGSGRRSPRALLRTLAESATAAEARFTRVVPA